MCGFGKRSERAEGSPEFSRLSGYRFPRIVGVESIACVLDSARLSLVLSLASKKEQMRNWELLCPQERI